MSETEFVVYIAMRRDLNMPRGKEIAQACHAILATERHYGDVSGLPIISVRAADLLQLTVLCAEARADGAWVGTVHDAGRTCVEPGTLTCAAIGPVRKGVLPLISAAECF